MNLKRRLALGSVMTIAVMVVIAVMSYLLMRTMEFSVLTITEEYSELREIDTARIRFTDARAALTAEPPRPDDALDALRRAAETLVAFVEEQDLHAGADELHHAEEAEIGGRLSARIDELRTLLASNVELDAPTRASAIGRIDQLRSDLSALAVTADHMVSESLEVTHRQLTVATTVLISSCAIGAIVVVILALLQHRWIVLPISTLRNRVRERMARRTAPATNETSPDMLGDLQRDFGGLIRELEGLYGSLEDRVHAKSRELVQSERLASVGYLAAGVAHEINNPLNAILGYAELTLRDLASPDRNGRPPEESVESLRVIRDETMRCKHIVEKLLSLVRKSDAPREAVDMIAVVDDVVAVVDRLKQFRGRTVESTLARDVPLVVFAREAEMKQILLNLLINALDATLPENGRVTIGADVDDGMVRVTVRDNGHGMSPATLNRVFEPFFTEKRGDSTVGTGLGLSIVHAIVLDHGGMIEAASDGAGRGSLFTVSLPQMHEEAAARV